MKNILRVSFFLALLILYGCVNQINKTTPRDYAEECRKADMSGRLGLAEQACYRALADVDIGNLGDEVKSQRLYNLGRIKRKIGTFDEAENLFKESLAIEEKLSGHQSKNTGRRLTELSVCLAAQKKWEEGASYMEKLLPVADSFSGHERSFVAEAFQKYSDHFKETNQTERAERFLKEFNLLNR